MCYATDALGSVLGLFYSDGSYSYDPYVQTRYQANDPAVQINHLRYIAGQYDPESGL